MNNLIFASTSTYKQQQLSSLGLKFQAVGSTKEENHKQNLQPEALALALAQEKAMNVALRHPNYWVLGSDQVAIAHDQSILTKPLTIENAKNQLLKCSGQRTYFYSAIWLTNGKEHLNACIETTVYFRKLTVLEIERYIAADNPLDCAGSFKAESLGISLFEKVTSEDPSALIGLPLIATCTLLRKAGFLLP